MFLASPRAAVLALFASAACAAKSTPNPDPGILAASVPPSLRMWIPWALRDLGDSACPAEVCLAASRLEVHADKHGASFALTGTRFSPGRVDLPGDSTSWPVEVRDGATGIPVVGDASDQPFVERPTGPFRITGRFHWKKRPATLALRCPTAVRRLEVDGKTAGWDLANSRMWLEDRLDGSADPGGDAATDADIRQDTVQSLEIRVSRLLADGSPMELETTIELAVGGKERRLRLPSILPLESRPLELNSPLAGRLDGQGGLELTVRPGTWRVVVKAALHGTPARFEATHAPDPWPEQEVWSFRDSPSFRALAFEGAPPVSPVQAGLDPSYRNLPAWSLDSSHPLVAKVVRLGAIHPDSLHLSLTRTLTIDAHDGGATVQDRFDVTTSNPKRFSILAPMVAGRIELNSEPQVITSLGGNETGVNLSGGKQWVNVLGRLPDGTWAHAPLSATSDQLDQAEVQVQAPAGWWILKVSGIPGADESGTWFSSWTHSEIVVTALVAGLFYLGVGRLAALLAVLAMVLGKHDQVGFSAWLCLGTTLFAQAIVAKASPRIRTMATRILLPVSVLCLAWCGLSGVRDTLDQWKRIVHPTGLVGVEVDRDFAARATTYGHQSVTAVADTARADPDQGRNAWNPNSTTSADARMTAWAPSTPSAVMSAPAMMDRINVASDGLLGEDVDPNAPDAIDVILAGGAGKIGLGSGRKVPGHKAKRAADPAHRTVSAVRPTNRTRDPFMDGAVQTGPGMPISFGETADLLCRVSPPAQAKVRISTLSTGWVRGVRLVGILLLWGLFLHVLRARFRGKSWWPAWPGSRSDSAPLPVAASLPGLVLLVLLVLLAAGGATAQEYPSQEMLEQLKQKLTESPACGDACGDISLVRMHAKGRDIRIEATVEALSRTAIELPRGEWNLQDISCPKCSPGADDDGPFVVVEKGTQTVVLSGRSQGDDVVFSFPRRPRALEVDLSGWERQDEGRASVHLSRSTGTTLTERDEDPTPARNVGAAPYVRIERSFRFGREWTATTRVVRASQFDGAIALSYPLLAGETSLDGQAIDSGKARWVLASGMREATFETQLRREDSVVLVASEGPWSETWHAEAMSRYQVLHEGIPATERGKLGWSPFPGERVKLLLKAWPSAPGPVITLRTANLHQGMDPRSPLTELNLETLVSQGTTLAVRIPDSVRLETVTCDGIEQLPNRLPDGRWSLSVPALTRQIRLVWRSEPSWNLFQRSPTVELSAGGANFAVQMEPYPERFVLAAGGDGAGTRCLWWAMLPFLALFAWVVSRLSKRKLSFVEGLLLLVPPSTIAGGLGHAYLLSIPIAILLVVHRRDAESGAWSPQRIRLVQIGIAVMGLAAAGSLLRLFLAPLANLPDFQPMHSAVSPWFWSLDRSAGAMPRAWILALPNWSWKAAMAIWALWVIRFSVPWIKRGWANLSVGGFWPANQPESEDPVDIAPEDIAPETPPSA